MTKKKFKIPSQVTIGLGVLAGILGGLNVASFGLAQPWSELVTFMCAAVASIGIGPLTHAALRNALHLPYPTALALAGVMTTATAGITAANMDQTLKGVLVGLLTAAAGVLVGPDSSPVVPAPIPTPTPAPAPSPSPPAASKK